MASKSQFESELNVWHFTSTNLYKNKAFFSKRIGILHLFSTILNINILDIEQSLALVHFD